MNSSQIRYSSSFSVDGHHYKFVSYISGEVDIYRLGDHDNPNGILGDSKNPVKAIRCFLKELSNYVFSEKPPFFSFLAYEKSRQDVYDRAIPQIEKLVKYKCVEKYNGYYLFQRLPS